MTTIAVTLAPKSFRETRKQYVEKLLAEFNGRAWSDAAKENYHEAIKSCRWLSGLPEREDPEETKWYVFLCALSHRQRHYCFLGMKAVFGFVEYDGVRSIHDLIRYFEAAVCR